MFAAIITSGTCCYQFNCSKHLNLGEKDKNASFASAPLKFNRSGKSRFTGQWMSDLKWVQDSSAVSNGRNKSNVRSMLNAWKGRGIIAGSRHRSITHSGLREMMRSWLSCNWFKNFTTLLVESSLTFVQKLLPLIETLDKHFWGEHKEAPKILPDRPFRSLLPIKFYSPRRKKVWFLS